MVPEFCELVQQVMELEEGSWKPQFIAGQSEVQGATRTLQLMLEGEESCGSEPLTTGVSVRISLNCRIPSWCHTELLDVWKTHNSVSEVSVEYSVE